MKPLISIVVPTKNRYQYLKFFVKTIMDLDSDEIELIIQDNSDTNEDFLTFINPLVSKKIKYFYTAESLSIIDNCDLGIKNSRGEYVCMMGDDDTISSFIIEFTKYMKQNNIDSARFTKASYKWKDIKYSGKNKVNLSVPKGEGRLVELDVEREFKDCLERAAIGTENMPCIYFGIINRDCLENIIKKSGTYFPGPSPDMANAIALCFEVKKHVFFDLPITIPGAGYNSATGQSKRKAHAGELKDVKHLSKNVEKNWEKSIPKIWTVQTIWYESALKALKSIGKEEYISQLNYPYFLANFYAYNKNYRHMTKKHLKTKLLFLRFSINLIEVTRIRIIEFIKLKINKLFRIINKKKINFENIENSFEASKTVDNLIRIQMNEFLKNESY